MSTEENRIIVRRFFKELLTAGNVSVADEILEPDFVFHGATATLTGLEDLKRTLIALHGSFSAQDYAIEDECVEGDKLVTRWTWRGTHQREYLGIAPTGKQVTAWGITLFYIAHGRIAESWEMWNALGLLKQLGATALPTVGS